MNTLADRRPPARCRFHARTSLILLALLGCGTTPGGSDPAGLELAWPTFDSRAAKDGADLPLAADIQGDKNGGAPGDSGAELAGVADATDAFELTDGQAPDLSDHLGEEQPGVDGLPPAEAVTPDLPGEVVEPPPAPLFDLPMIFNATTAQCQFEDHKTLFKNGQLVDAWHVKYWSWEVIDGKLNPILIQGFASRPVSGGSSLPGIVQAHGLGGFATIDHATGTAALTGAFVLAYTGPGGGDAPDNQSGGLAAGHDNGYRLFDVIEDLRESWFWGHAVAAMRGLTCLENHPQVDKQRLGITGFSAGGVISTLVAGRDPRVKAAVPLSGTLAWGVAVQAPNAWQHMLLQQAGLSVASAEWIKLMELVEPTTMLAGSSAAVMMVNGSCDEFFPLTAHLATYAALPAGRRTSIAANFDHGCYSLTGLESAGTIEERAKIRAEGGQRAWFGHHFGTDDRFAYLPQPPSCEVLFVGTAPFGAALVDSGGSKLAVEKVSFWLSNDDAFYFAELEMSAMGAGLYATSTPIPVQANSVFFADVQYKTKELLLPDRFSLSSEPVMPPLFVPHIRHWESCL